MGGRPIGKFRIIGIAVQEHRQAPRLVGDLHIDSGIPNNPNAVSRPHRCTGERQLQRFRSRFIAPGVSGADQAVDVSKQSSFRST